MAIFFFVERRKRRKFASEIKTKRKMKTKNKYGIEVKMCCASCAYKQQTRTVSQRWCIKHEKMVNPQDVCPQWKMNKTLQALGREWGKVKDKETKEVCIY